jgi:hypothetical protein
MSEGLKNLQIPGSKENVSATRFGGLRSALSEARKIEKVRFNKFKT